MDLEVIPVWLRDIMAGNLWIVQVALVVFLLLFFDFIAKRILRRLRSRLNQSTKGWDDAVTDALQQPLILLIWIVGVAFAADIVQQQTAAPIFQAVRPIRDIGVIAAITWFLIRLSRRIEANIVFRYKAAGEPIDHSTIGTLGKLVRLSIIITATLAAFQTLGYGIAGILAFGAVSGIAIGFAAKDLLANFFGALMIYLDRPFRVGDWIRASDGNIEGTVESIGWRLTVVRTFDKRPVYIPNSLFTRIAIDNASRMDNRCIFQTISVRHKDIHNMDAMVKDVKSMLVAHKDIDDSLTIMVSVNAFSVSSIELLICAFTCTGDWVRYHEIKQDILLRIGKIISEHGAEITGSTATQPLAEGIMRQA